MNYELNKREFERVKREELAYIDSVAQISSSKTLSETEKLEIYRTLNSYEVKLNEILKKLWSTFPRNDSLTKDNLKDIIIEIDLPKDYLSSLNFQYDEQKKYVLKKLWIDPETLKFKLTLYNLMRCREYWSINSDTIQNNQRLIEEPIYIFSGYYDTSEDCYGPCFGDPDDYLYGIYENIRNNGYSNDKKEIPKKDIDKFEKDKIIIHSKSYVYANEIRKIFEEELLNSNNQTLNDCVIQTRNKIEELNYTRSPEYKEKVLLERINELYKRVKGEFIGEEILYTGNFLQILRETYRFPNGNTILKEKNIKNGGKDSVIVIAITQEKEYIITIQNRIKDKLIAEFPSGYIENEEEPIETAKRELKEETGYVSDDLFLVDEAYTSPGTDNSKTYIVVANNCIKTDQKSEDGTELVEYGLFSEKELEYLINKNIINGAMNKLAYYNLVNNVDDCNVHYVKSNKKIYKTLREKKNPLG